MALPLKSAHIEAGNFSWETLPASCMFPERRHLTPDISCMPHTEQTFVALPPVVPL